MLQKNNLFFSLKMVLLVLSMTFVWACNKPQNVQNTQKSHTHESVKVDEQAINTVSGTVIHNVKGASLETINAQNNAYTLTTFDYLHFSEDGKVISTGQGSDYPKSAQHIDGKGRFMLPGLIDAHGHVQGLGVLMQELDLFDTTTKADALINLKQYAADNPEQAWIVGRGWNQTRWPSNAFPSAADIDAVISDRPVVLFRVDGHAVWLNTNALNRTAIRPDTQDPVGGKIMRDTDGNATGILVDHAEQFITDVMPVPSVALVKEQTLLSMQTLASLGMTAVHDAGVNMTGLKAYQALVDAKQMPIRVYAMLGGMETLNQVDKPYRSADERFLVESVKLYSDGALGSRGAALIEPYSDEPDNSGLLFNPEETYVEYLKEGRRKGFQMNTHAIGDKGNRVMLNAYEKAGALPEERHRIEHSQVVNLDDIPRFKEIGIIPSMQATHATSDMNMAGDRVGEERLKGAYAWQKFLQQGSRVANGSDFPVERPHIFEGLYAAVTRQDKQGSPDGGWIPSEKMSREETLKSFTIDAAYAAHMDDTTGSLEAGKWADFILVDKDFFTIPSSEIKDIDVLETWVGGERVY